MAACPNSIDPAVSRVRIMSGLFLWLLSAGCGEVSQPSPSTPSDGLVFVRATDAGDTDIFWARIADGAVRRLAETPNLLDSNPKWVPSVLRVVYEVRPTDAPTSSLRLAMREPLGAEPATVSEKSFLKESDVSVSMDGKRLAYVFQAPPGGQPPLGVRVASPMTGLDAVMGTVPKATAYISPRLSPDVDSVAVQTQGKNRGDDLWLLLLKNEHEPLVAERRWHDTAPRFERAGGSVFFSRSAFQRVPKGRGRKARPRAEPLGGGDICRVHLATKQVACVIQSADAREYGVELSPTREEMVFVRERDGASALFVAGLQGDDERQLRDSPEPIQRGPVWSPDGDRLAYVAGQSPQQRILVIDRQGAVLFETPGDQPAWAPPFQD